MDAASPNIMERSDALRTSAGAPASILSVRLFADYPLKVALSYKWPPPRVNGVQVHWRLDPWTISIQEWCAANCKHEWMMALGLRDVEIRFGFDDMRDAALHKMIYNGYYPT